MSQEHVLIAATRLLEQLCIALADAEAGARVLRLLLFGVDGEVESLELGLATASRDPHHMAALVGLRLDRLQLNSGFGFEGAALQVVVAQPLPAHQSALTMDEEHVAPDSLARLVDRLQQRLGAGAVYQLQPVESHISERAERAVPVTSGKAKEHGLPQDAAENAPIGASASSPAAAAGRSRRSFRYPRPWMRTWAISFCTGMGSANEPHDTP